MRTECKTSQALGCGWVETFIPQTTRLTRARSHTRTWKLTAAVEKIKMQFLSHSHAEKQSHNLLTVIDFVRLLWGVSLLASCWHTITALQQLFFYDLVGTNRVDSKVVSGYASGNSARPLLDFEASHSDRWHLNGIFSPPSKLRLHLTERAGVLDLRTRRKTSRGSADAHTWPKANILRQSLCC